MTIWTKSELLEALSGELLAHQLPDNLTINEVVIDSRKTLQNGLFIAIKGEKNDGHNFLQQAFENGCKTLLVQDAAALSSLKDPQFLQVKNTFTALYKLAEFSRKRSKAKIIAITGSVGKTSTKEMLKLVFDSQGKTFATPGNLNNHFGLPLSLCNFSADCAYGIFEMGMNHLGEIEPLSKIARPHLALITTVGPVHIEFFKNEQEIALAKSEIFAGLVDGGFALLNCDNHHFSYLQERCQASGIKPLSFGKKDGSNYQILHSSINDSSSALVEAKLKNGTKFYYEISSSNPTTIFNSIIAVACLELLGSDFIKGITELKNLKTFNGRGNFKEIISAGKKISIIDDTYNASLLSMKAGINHAIDLKKNLGKQRVIIALGDMLELGHKSAEIHEETLKYLAAQDFDLCILVGEEMKKAAAILPKNSYKTFATSEAAALEISSLLQDQDLIYLKGSRGIKMEKIIEKIS